MTTYNGIGWIDQLEFEQINKLLLIEIDRFPHAKPNNKYLISSIHFEVVADSLNKLEKMITNWGKEYEPFSNFQYGCVLSQTNPAVLRAFTSSSGIEYELKDISLARSYHFSFPGFP